MPKGIYKRIKPVWNKGLKGICKVNSGSFKKGLVPWHKGKKNVYSKETLEKFKKAKLGKKQSKETIEKRRIVLMGHPSWSKGKISSEETKEKISKSLKGKKKPLRSEEHCKKISENRRGKGNGLNHWNWQGGITSINSIIRRSENYKLWRKSVFERDNYICVCCGKKGVQLQADHIKPFCLYPELRFSIDNGRTLCKSCHIEIGWNKFKEDNPRKNNKKTKDFSMISI